MSQKDCIAKFLGKINHTELFDTSAEYQARGQSEQEAMLSAVQDKIQELEIEQTQVMQAVRDAWVKDGGKEAKPIKGIPKVEYGSSASSETMDLRKLAHTDERPGDVLLGNDKFVTMDQAVAAARAEMTEREWGMPFQFNRVLDIAPRDWKRMVDAMKNGSKGVAMFSRGTNEPVTKSKDVVGNQGGRSADDISLGDLQTEREKNALVYREFQKSDPEKAFNALQRMRAIDAEIREAEAAEPSKQEESYRGEHEAPMHDSGAPLHNLKGTYPDDFYGPQGQQYYGIGDGSDTRAMSIVRSLKGRPGHPVTVFRAVPKEVTAKIGKGDWVTIDRQYAKDHGDGALNGNYKIIQKTVRADELFTNGDSIQEWGYDPKKQRDEAAPAQAKSVKDIAAAWDALGIKNTISEKNGTIELSRIEVPAKDRNSGVGTKAMQQLLDYADSTVQRITLTPSSDFGGSKGRLIDFYKGFGFKENKGRSRDFTTRDTMIREPKPNESTAPDSGGAFSRGDSQTDTPAFRKWFGDSKVVDADGKPLVVYHGTADSFNVFDLDHPNRKDTGWLGTGVYATDSENMARSYSNLKAGSSEPSVMKLYARIENPYYATIADKQRLQLISNRSGAQAGRDAADAWTQSLKDKGHDGVILEYKENQVGSANASKEIVVFDPAGVKSATGNNGQFDGMNPDIRFARNPFGTPTTVTALQSAIKELTGMDGSNKLGRIVATTASEIKSTWEPLIGQSVNIESEGDAGAAQGFFDPNSKTIFLIADNIREGAETAVLAHELMHKHGQTVLGKEGWDRLHGVIGTWANADQESNEYAVYNYARSKVEAVGVELSNQELFPYAVEAAIKMGIKPDMSAGRGTVARWLESVRQNLKMVWAKITGKPETFKAQDMVNLAFGIAQMENPENSAYIKDFDNSDKSTTINSGTDQNERTAGNSESPGIGRQDAEQDMATSLGGEPAPRGWSSATRISREGRPITVYRGAAEPLHISHFGKSSLGKASGNPSSGLGVWFTTGKGEAQTYGTASSHNLDIRNPKLIRADELQGFDSVDDAHAYRENLRKQGYDGILISARHLGKQELHIVAFEPDQVIDPKGSIQFSRIVGQTNRQHTPEQLRAMKNVGFDVDAPTLKERAQAMWKDAGKKLAQGIADQFAPVKDLDKNAYGLLRLAKGASGAFESLLQGGKLKLTDGVYDFDEANKGGVIDKLLIPLQGEHHDFMRWVAANRAERLAGEGRENLFSAQDIADLKTLASETTDFDYTVQTGPSAGRVTRDRTLIYADANRVFNEFNKNVLDMAEQSGLIDGASRKVWEHEFYVPFYRVADEDGGGVRGMSVKGSVLRQQAFKELKGGKNALNTDLLDNTLLNWAHLLDASAKNRAAKATIEAAERMGVATGGNQSTLASMGASVHNKNGVVWFMDGGQKRYSLIDNTGDGPFLMTALNALEYAGMRNPVMNAMGAMKHVLTVGVTASPFFKIRNLIRDSVQVIGTGNINYNPAANIAQGWKLTDPKSDSYFRLLAGGGTIHFGTMLEGSEAKRVQALVESGVDDATILNSDHKVKAFYRKFIEPGITAYNELGNRGEAINRAALYDQLKKQGLSHADASLQARDLMDFSMQGSFTSIRFLTQVVPFFNARIQGLYKLGKSAKENPARFGAVLGAVTVFSLALLAAYGDDDDWKKREEWDRNNFWWFKFGGQAFRIPKPFEIGAVATLAERGFELAFDKEMTNKRFMNQVMTLLGDNLSMNPVPQLVKPMLDVYSNKDSFSGRPIETMGMDKLKSEYRFTDRTSMTARAISTGLNAVTELAGKESLSPVQVDSMLRGYFGWLGSFVVGAADVLARPATGQNERASSDIWKAATGGMASDLRDAPSRYVSQMYDQAKELEQVYGTWRALQKQGKTAEAQEFAKENRDKLGRYRSVETVKRSEAMLNERIRLIERSSKSSDEKRELIRKINAQKDRAARAVAP